MPLGDVTRNNIAQRPSRKSLGLDRLKDLPKARHIGGGNMSELNESPEAIRCWALSEGHAGMENQCIALAERVGLPYRIMRVHPRAPWTWLPPGWWPAPARALDGASDRLEPPWPDLVISCGRRAVPYGLLSKRLSGGKVFVVHLQNPQTRLSKFDLIAAPRHDRLSGPNVIPTLGSLHRVTPERLRREAARIARALAHLPRPLVVALIGGSNRCYRLTPEIARSLGAALARLAREQGLGLAVTPSRRTGLENIRVLARELAEVPAVLWDFEGENPYLGYLGLADHIVVTADSVNMVSEAAATGKPVHVVALAGGNAKFRAFHRSMTEHGYTRPFDSWLHQSSGCG